jgi:Ca-activated chloride channel homolog
MSFGHPLLLLTLLVVPAALLALRLAERRRMRYAVKYTNLEVLASVAGGRQWRRWIPTGLALLALATLCTAFARPHATSLVPKERATVILVLDVSGSMQAQDVKPTRLVAAQHAIHAFLDKLPDRVRVGLILFAGDPVVATPPTADHDLVGEAVDTSADFSALGGTAIGDALALAVRLGRQIAGTEGARQTALEGRQLAALRTTVAPRRPLVSILFLSDGHQTRGTLQPLQGARRAKAAGFPVYTVALGTTGNTTLRGRNGSFGYFGGPGGFTGGAFRGRGLAPDPATLHRIATTTGGKFFRAKTAGAVRDAYAKLGSRLGRAPDHKEITDEFVAGAAVLLLLAGLASAVWAPRLP